MSPEARNIDPNSVRPETFNRLSYFLIPRLIEPALADFFWSYVHIRFASLQLSSGDAQVPNTPSGYGDPAFDGLLEYLRPRIEECAGLALYPTYSYFRLYKRDDVLKRHRDRSACEISVTLNIGQAPAAPWPIYVERHEGPFEALLEPGDALLYRGCDCFHWRDRYQGDHLAQVFLHYVDRNGSHADEKFDQRLTLMRPPGGKPNEGNQAPDA